MKKCLLLIASVLCVHVLFGQQTTQPQYQRTESNGVRVYESPGYVNQQTTIEQPVQENNERPRRTIETYSMDEVEDGLTYTTLKLEDARLAGDAESIRIYEAEITRLKQRKEQLTEK